MKTPKIRAAQLAAITFLLVFGLNLANPVQKVRIAAAGISLDLEADDILVVATLQSENITYYIASSAMSALSGSVRTSQTFTVDSLTTNLASGRYSWDFACPDIQQQFPSAAARLLPTNRFSPSRSFSLMAGENETLTPEGYTGVEKSEHTTGMFLAADHKEYNMSAYDLSNHTLKTKYSSFADYYVKNNSRTDLESDVTKKQRLQTHLAGFPSLEQAWKDLTRSLLGAQHGVSSASIMITDYDAKAANMSTYYSKAIVDTVRKDANDAVTTAATFAFNLPGVTPAAAFGFSLPKLDIISAVTDFVPSVDVVTNAINIGGGYASDFGISAVITPTWMNNLVPSIMEEIQDDSTSATLDTVGGAGVANPAVEASYSTQLPAINAMLSEDQTHTVGTTTYSAHTVIESNDMLSEPQSAGASDNHWNDEAFVQATTIHDDKDDDVLIFIIIVAVLAVVGLAAVGLLLYFKMGEKIIPV